MRIRDQNRTDHMVIRNQSRVEHIRLDANDKTYFTPEGYLIDNPIVTRTGIFEYHNPDGSVRKEFRPPEEVFAKESLESYVGKPVIITHDAGYVNKDSAPDEEIGTILEKGYRDGDNVRAKIVIHDTNSLKDCGLRELSLGYNVDFDYTPGEYEGEKYDCVQKNIRINHLALVANARAGENARLNIDGKDRETERNPVKGKNPVEGGENLMGKKRRFDGEIGQEEFADKLEKLTADNDQSGTVEDDPAIIDPEKKDEEELTTEEKIAEVKQHQDRRDADDDPQDLESATKVIDEQGKDIQTLLDCIDEMEAEKDMAKDSDCEEKTDEDEETKEEETLNQDSVDRVIRERLSVARVGDKLNMDGLENMSVIAAKKAIIKKVSPNLRLDGKSKAYINAAYDLAVDKVNSLKSNSIALQKRQMMGMNMDGMPARQTGLTAAQKAREAMIAKKEGGR